MSKMRFKITPRGYKDYRNAFVESDELLDLFQMFLDEAKYGVYEIKKVADVYKSNPVMAEVMYWEKPQVNSAAIVIKRAKKAHVLNFYRWPTMHTADVHSCGTHEKSEEVDSHENCEFLDGDTCYFDEHRSYNFAISQRNMTIPQVVEMFLDEFGGELPDGELEKMVDFLEKPVED